MFYLSDVSGGLTAFPQLGLATKVTKGAAVFWFNLDQAGEWEQARIIKLSIRQSAFCSKSKFKGFLRV